jgi:hypothetical protein
MPKKEIALELAAFLDSPQASRLTVGRDEIHGIAEALLTVCYDQIGKQPRFLDSEDVTGLLTRELAPWFAPRDPSVEHAPAVIRAYFEHLETTQVVTQAYEIGRALDESMDSLLDEVRSGRNTERQVARTRDPFVHGASKLGRNDPCSCGSGKKYKKCHGKND